MLFPLIVTYFIHIYIQFYDSSVWFMENLLKLLKCIWKVLWITKKKQTNLFKEDHFSWEFFYVLFFNFHKWKMLTNKQKKNINQRLKRTRFIQFLFISIVLHFRSEILFACRIVFCEYNLILFTPLEEHYLLLVLYTHVSLDCCLIFDRQNDIA